MEVLDQRIDSGRRMEPRYEKALRKPNCLDCGVSGQTQTNRFVNFSQQPPEVINKIIDRLGLTHWPMPGNEPFDIKLVLTARQRVYVLARTTFQKHGVPDALVGEKVPGPRC